MNGGGGKRGTVKKKSVEQPEPTALMDEKGLYPFETVSTTMGSR